MLAIVYLTLVWCAVRADPLRSSGAWRCRRIDGELPDWVEPVVHYILLEGLPGTLQRLRRSPSSAASLIGIVLGTLLTIDFRALADG
mgnify:CR=1 FL=1